MWCSFKKLTCVPFWWSCEYIIFCGIEIFLKYIIKRKRCLTIIWFWHFIGIAWRSLIFSFLLGTSGASSFLYIPAFHFQWAHEPFSTELHAILKNVCLIGRVSLHCAVGLFLICRWGSVIISYASSISARRCFLFHCLSNSLMLSMICLHLAAFETTCGDARLPQNSLIPSNHCSLWHHGKQLQIYL